MRARDYRARAREQLDGNIFKSAWLWGLLVCFIADAILSAISFTAIGTLILAGPLGVGVSLFFLKQAREKQSDLGAMFGGFSDHFANRCLTGVMVSIFTFLWTLLFIIPGIIKSYAYSMSMYISADNPEYDWKQCIDGSRAMMKGNKWKLFCLDLSFIGWYIVGCLAFGIGMLWVLPYHEAARAQFYLNLIGGNAAEEPAQETSVE
ncbi:MAG: DUF975 family protein [Clostridia bacterium]|nr:DUF975 family protein [Clostridia bacterium]